MIWKNYNQLLDASIRKKIVACVFLSFCEIFPVAAITLLLQHALNIAIVSHHLSSLFLDGFLVLLATLVINGIALINSRIAVDINQKISRNVYSKIIEKCLRINPMFYHEERAVSSNHLLLQDTERFHSIGFIFLTKFVPAIVVSCAISFLLFFLNPFLAFVLILSIPIFAGSGRLIEKKLKNISAMHRHCLQSFNQGIHFLFGMMDLIQTQSMQDFEGAKRKGSLDQISDQMRNLLWLNTLYSLSQNLIMAAASLLILIVGGAMVIQGKMDWGHLIAFYVAVGMLRRYGQTLILSIPQLIEGNLALTKLQTFLAEPENSAYQGIKPISFRGNVRLHEVSFHFGGKPLLEKINLSIQEGEIVSLLGPNGSGKSTIVNLILGFYRPQEGALYFEGEPLDSLDLKPLRSSISVVRQNPLIFPGTIKENILYGAFHCSDEKMREAVQLVGLTEFIENLPLKFDSPVGVSGAHLSGGQRQKLALARAIVREPKLLILDEPTNHLDVASIELIFDHLKNWKKKMSILVISHHRDLSSLADRTYFLQK